MRRDPCDSTFDADALRNALPLFRSVCEITGNRRLIAEATQGLQASGVIKAVERRDDDALFEWLMSAVSYQGIGDAVATRYLLNHGAAQAHELRASLSRLPPCPKLLGYWTFEGCRYHKGSRTCGEPEHVDLCPLPMLDLRNGRLNQTAYALFLFFRDVARGDFVGWIDRQLELVADVEIDRSAQLGAALLKPLGHVHGVSSKVLSMALSDLLLAAGNERPLWRQAGAGMIAVDSLVHNWLHRTGVLAKFGCDHPYGDRCYSKNGCAEIIRRVSAQIDARDFNYNFPEDFPRFVQKAIWWFCAQAGLNTCNGNQIDDREPCALADCPLEAFCERRILHPPNLS